MNGTSMRDLMELGGWSEYRMVLRYSHLDSTHLARVVDNIPAPAMQQDPDRHDRPL